MFQGDGIERVEAIAQVPLGTLRHLILARPDRDMTVDRLVHEDLTQALGVTAEVRLDLGDRTAEWDAELVRLRDTVDPATRTVGLVVAIANPFEQAIPGERPPLTKGMFVEVILRGTEMPEQIVVPRQAIRDGRVWVVDAQDRLRSRAVTRRFEPRGISLIAAGVSAGERVVLSDPTPMVAGMRVRAEPDGAAARARFRPIVLTSITTVAGLLPLLLEESLQAQVLIPLAASLAFGLATATLIALVLVPAVYCILGDWGRAKTS